MFESRTVEVTDAGRVEITRSPGHGIRAVVQVATTSVTTRVDGEGLIAVTVAQDGVTIWEYEMRAAHATASTPSDGNGHDAHDVNAELREQVAQVLVPPRRRGRPPKAPVPRRVNANMPTLAELAARQAK
jgi:hypothetical protein